MVERLLRLSKKNSYFLFGARGVGKSTLIRRTLEHHPQSAQTKWIDLLNDELLETYLLNPQLLYQELSILKKNERPDWVVIDEVQKAPKLLNVVHQILESDMKIKFALTGSSSRRLKQKGVNLLAGRAWVENLYPLTHQELDTQFDLNTALRFGTLPQTLKLPSDEEKSNYLRSYALTYIKQEIQEEQWVRKIEPFRRFLPIVSQMNGEPINALNIARDVGVESATVRSYFDILEETLIGFQLPAYHKSIRKQQMQSSKFYFFDLGVKNALEKKLTQPLFEQTSEFGKAFEHFIICEMIRLDSYNKSDYSFYYLRTKDNLEIDIVIDRPGQKTALVEIKSKKKVDERDTRHLELIHKDFKNSECFLLSQDPQAKKIGSVKAYPWQLGLSELGLM